MFEFGLIINTKKSSGESVSQVISQRTTFPITTICSDLIGIKISNKDLLLLKEIKKNAIIHITADNAIGENCVTLESLRPSIRLPSISEQCTYNFYANLIIQYASLQRGDKLTIVLWFSGAGADGVNSFASMLSCYLCKQLAIDITVIASADFVQFDEKLNEYEISHDCIRFRTQNFNDSLFFECSYEKAMVNVYEGESEIYFNKTTLNEDIAKRLILSHPFVTSPARQPNVVYLNDKEPENIKYQEDGTSVTQQPGNYSEDAITSQPRAQSTTRSSHSFFARNSCCIDAKDKLTRYGDEVETLLKTGQKILAPCEHILPHITGCSCLLCTFVVALLLCGDGDGDGEEVCCSTWDPVKKWRQGMFVATRGIFMPVTLPFALIGALFTRSADSICGYDRECDLEGTDFCQPDTTPMDPCYPNCNI